MTAIEAFSGRNETDFGVVVELDEECAPRERMWLAPLDKVFTGSISVPADVRAALVSGNESLINGPCIDYGYGAQLGQAVFESQSVMVDDALGSLGMVWGRDYFSAEYSGILCGPGAVFHVDDGFGTPGALFVVTSVIGRGVLTMPNLRWSSRFEVGKTVIFDALQVHGLCQEAGGPAGGCQFVVVAAEVRLTVDGCRKLGLIRSESEANGVVELNRNFIDGKTGKYVIRSDELAFL